MASQASCKGWCWNCLRDEFRISSAGLEYEDYSVLWRPQWPLVSPIAMLCYRLLLCILLITNMALSFAFVPVIDGIHSSALYLTSWSYLVLVTYALLTTILLALSMTGRFRTTSIPAISTISNHDLDVISNGRRKVGDKYSIHTVFPDTTNFPTASSPNLPLAAVQGDKTLKAIAQQVLDNQKIQNLQAPPPAVRCRSEGALQGLLLHKCEGEGAPKKASGTITSISGHGEDLLYESNDNNNNSNNNNNALKADDSSVRKSIVSDDVHIIYRRSMLASFEEFSDFGGESHRVDTPRPAMHNILIRAFAKIMVITYNICMTFCPMVTGVYYGYAVPYYGRTNITYLDFSMHAIPTMVVLVELVLNSIPVRLLHVFHPVLFALSYVTMTVIYWAAQPQRNVLYVGILDWAMPGQSALLCLGLILGILPVFVFLYFIARFRMQIFNRYCR